MAFLFIFLAIVIFSSEAFGDFNKKIRFYQKPITWITVGIIASTSLFLHLFTYSYQIDYAKAITSNIVAHEIVFLLDSLNKGSDQIIGKMGDIQSYENAVWARKWLVHDQGDFKFLDKEFPLIKYNYSFSRPGNRKGIWNRKLIEKPNIVLLFLESFRAHDIGVYGSRKGLTPYFDKHAKTGWLWTNFYASGVQTPRAALATLCSVYPYLGKSIQRSNTNLPLRGLPSILNENGYITEFYHNGRLKFDKKIPFFPNLGFKRTFGMKDLDPQDRYGNYGWGFPDVEFAKLLAIRLNGQDPNIPLFLTAFTVSHHHPWDVPDNNFKVIKEKGLGEYPRFLNSMHYTDHALGIFFKNINKKALNNTIFFILADTAQPMGEHHNNFALIRYLYEENLRIPFLIYAPGFIREGRRFPEIASQVDIMPTILDMLNIGCINHSVGRSLLSEMNRPFAFFSNPNFELRAGVRMGRYKFIHQFKDNEDILFNLEIDPLERKNVAPIVSQVTENLKKITFEKAMAIQPLVNRRKIWYRAIQNPSKRLWPHE
jgi:arylsulfatase A-like enzyme